MRTPQEPRLLCVREQAYVESLSGDARQQALPLIGADHG